MKIHSYLQMKFSCKNIFRGLSYVPLSLLFCLIDGWSKFVWSVFFFMSVLNFIHPNMQFYILHLLWNWKDDKASCFCALFRATMARNLTPLTQFRGSTRISRERAGIHPHTITAPPPNEQTPKQPCFWTRTTQIIHTIYLVITINISQIHIDIFNLTGN